MESKMNTGSVPLCLKTKVQRQNQEKNNIAWKE